MSTNKIIFQTIIPEESLQKILKQSENTHDLLDVADFFSREFQIDITTDKDIINGYERDSSNIKGNGDILCRPKNELECALILKWSQLSQIPITISAGKTNLTGSATPKGGIILSTEKMTQPAVKVDYIANIVSTPVGVYLEDMRKEVLRQSNKTLYYPVDPTSREEAMVGGILSCNASGFIPGPAGATRYWTEGIDFLIADGYKISCRRGDYVSENGEFILEYPNKSVILTMPTYPRPDIKNASGPFSDLNGRIDLVDFLVGSEGIFGVITSAIFTLKKMPDEFLDLFFTLPKELDAISFHQYISNHFKGDLSQITALEYFGYNCQTYMKHRDKLFNSTSEVGIYLQIPLYNETVEDVAEDWFNILLKSDCNINEDGIILLNTPQNWKTFFEARHSIPANALEKTQKLDTWSILTDTIVPSSHFPEFLKVTHTILQTANIEYLLFGHLGDCHLHFHLIPTRVQQPKALEAYNQIIKNSAELGGIYSAEHGTGKRKRMDFIKCFGERAADQVRNAKAAIDPGFILNRGNVIKYKLPHEL